MLLPRATHQPVRAFAAAIRHLVLFALLLVPAGLHAQGTEIVRGKIVGLDGKPIPDATVIVTGLLTQATLTAHSNAKGIFTALFPNAEGDYLVNIRKIGYAPFNTRVTRSGLSSLLNVDATMQQLLVELDTLRSIAKSLTPTGDAASIGGAEQSLLSGALFSLDPGDLTALAAQLPGILSLGDSAFSVLGSDPNSNNATLDGAKFNGGRLPPDAAINSKLIQTSADPRVSGFNGGQTASFLRGGTDVFALTARGSLADSHLAWADPEWTSPIPRNILFSGTAGGPIVKKKLHYQASWNVSDNRSDIFSLLDPPDAIISQYGLTRDTIAAVSAALSSLHIPTSPAGVPDGSHGQFVNNSLVFDWTPKSTTALRVSQSGFWSTNGSPGRAPFSYPSQGNHSANQFQFLSAKLTGYIHGFLDELNGTLNYSHFNSAPYALLPSANVRVGTVFDGGITGLASLSFGGGSGVSTNTSYDWDLNNEFSWIPSNGKHKVKIGQEIDYSSNSSFQAANQYGAYTYQTLSDLIANRPASYSLTLTSFERTSHGAIASAWIGDEWNASKAWNFQGGLHFDRAIPATTPLPNPAVTTAFGIHTDQFPTSQVLTPRLGFSWASAKRRGMGSANGIPQGISLPNLPGGLSPEFLQALLGTPRGSVAPGIGVNGSIGAYGGPVNPSAIAGLIDQTGLPNTRRVLTCVGDATPIPDWDLSQPGPTSCLDGTGPATFSSNVPSVQVYDPAYRAALTWRANLGIDGIRLPGKWTLGITGYLNYGVNGSSAFDLNLNRTAQFTLPDEANRQVFVTPNSIVPSTGVVAPGAYRLNADFGSVRDVVSDLHNHTAQLQLSIAPPRPLFHGKLSLNSTYSLTYGERQQRGLGGGFGGGITIINGGSGFFFSGDASGFGGGGSYAVGDPFNKVWVRGAQPTHQIQTTASLRAWWFNINARLNVYSGTPFTPSVSGDINGDGANDDLAFIPNPATTRDPALAAQMTQLLANAPAGARDCLMRQLGQIAGVNSCTTQWQARLDLGINWQPPRSFGFGDRLRVTTQMQNTSGALVRLFGLENTPLGRGALSTTANSQLLYVTGFDPATQSFKYGVNQLFGQPSNFGSSRRKYAPFQVQLGVEYKLGGPPTAPMAMSMGLLPGKNEPPYTVEQLRDKMARLSKDPTQVILTRKDSLALSTEQVAKITAISRTLRARIDSALDPVIEYALKKGRRIDDQQLSSRLQKAQKPIQQMLKDADAEARALLTPAQLRMLPVTPAPGMNVPGAGRSPQGPGGGAPVGTPTTIHIGGDE